MKDYCFPSNSKILLFSSIPLPSTPTSLLEPVVSMVTRRVASSSHQKATQRNDAIRESGGNTRPVLFQKSLAAGPSPAIFTAFSSF